MPTLTGRKTIRQTLATLLGEITEYQTGWDHQVKKTNGISPVFTVHSDGTRRLYSDYVQEMHRFVVSILVKRVDDDTSEDLIDDLELLTVQKLADNAQHTYWQDLEIDPDFSQMDYPLIEGIQYRREQLRLTVLAI